MVIANKIKPQFQFNGGLNTAALVIVMLDHRIFSLSLRKLFHS